MRHKQQEYLKNKNVLLLVTRLETFPLVELSLGWVLSSRAILRFTQQANVLFFILTQFIEQTLFELMIRVRQKKHILSVKMIINRNLFDSCP